ncbi:hypothetical protein MKX08_004448 [Trichoderma sp. CBMAI-0020]|nr:hypothetical protein MKX08_004448 [Trichoderma sp. CBMAI-0020]
MDMAAEQSGHASEAKTLADSNVHHWLFAAGFGPFPSMGAIELVHLLWGRFPWLWLPALPYSSPTGPLQVPYRSPTELLWGRVQQLDQLPASDLVLGESRDRGAADLFAAAVAVDENGLTFAARRGSQRGAGRSRRGFWGSSLLEEGTLRHGWIGCHACAKKSENQTSYDAQAQGSSRGAAAGR